MSKKRKKRTGPAGRSRVVVLGSDPKMSEVILELADPLLDGDVANPKEVDFIVQLTIAAWNKAMFSSDRQAAMERDIIAIRWCPRTGMPNKSERSSRRWTLLKSDERDSFRISASSSWITS